jgi:hypothetical protein
MPSRWLKRVLMGLAAATLLASGVAAVAAWQAYKQLGRTPAELLDYVDRRLLGHPKLEWLSAPFLGALRTSFDATPAADRARQGFDVPPPPPRRGAAEVLADRAVPEGATVWRVGPNGPYLRIADVARLAKSGDVVEIEAGDYRADVAVWSQSRLVIRGVGGAARLIADGQVAEGKAIWVIRRGDFDISNIDFVGARAGDGNGAGIRFEGGRLRLRHCLFWGNQMGLLTSNGDHAKDSSLTIENSEFAYSFVAGRWGHNLYVGTIDSLAVTGSWFHHAGVGHLLKSRARRSEVRYSRLTDESGGRASYEMEFPNGGTVVLVGNTVQQQVGTENSVMVSYGTEGYSWPVNSLAMAGNTLVNDNPHGGTFIRVSPGATQVTTANNLLVGPGALRLPDFAVSFNDQRAGWEHLVRPSRQDFRIASADARFAYRPLPDQPAALTPTAQYVHPLTVQPLAARPAFVGADQRPAR